MKYDCISWKLAMTLKLPCAPPLCRVADGALYLWLVCSLTLKELTSLVLPASVFNNISVMKGQSTQEQKELRIFTKHTGFCLWAAVSPQRCVDFFWLGKQFHSMGWSPLQGHLLSLLIRNTKLQRHKCQCNPRHSQWDLLCLLNHRNTTNRLTGSTVNKIKAVKFKQKEETK